MPELRLYLTRKLCNSNAALFVKYWEVVKISGYSGVHHTPKRIYRRFLRLRDQRFNCIQVVFYDSLHILVSLEANTIYSYKNFV